MDEFTPAYVVVSNRTSEHMETLEEIQATAFDGVCFVEKPLFEKSVGNCDRYGFDVCVGYVMRFHPLIQQASGILVGKRLLSMDVYAGQYLPDWRPGTDYRRCYSARKEQGGGVLRDLSHELDYILLLAGVWSRVTALGGHFSELEIDSDDGFSLLMETEQCPLVTCQLNYLDRNRRRDCTVQYEGGTVHIDFIKNKLTHNGESRQSDVEWNDIFKAMHAAAWLPGALGVCSFKEAFRTLELIDAAERSTKERRWVCRQNR
jgi:predicted dehydrogenase